MTARTTGRLAWALCGVSIATLVVVLTYGLVEPSSGLVTGNVAGLAVTGATLLFVGAFATVGALVASRRPQNPIGWLLSVAGLCYAIGAAGLLINELPGGGRWADWIGSWVWGLGGALAMSFVLLLFPTGHLPSRRWRPVAWPTAATIGAFVLGSAFATGRISDTQSINPLGFGGSVGRAVFGVMRVGGTLGFTFMAVAAFVSLVVRYRRGDGSEREQLRWLIFAGIVIGAGGALEAVVSRVVHDPTQANDLGNAISSITIAFVPIAIGIAVLKYRLYDIDVIIKKTLVYGVLAVFITVVYATIVVGVGAIVGAHSSAALSAVAAAIVALAFQPARRRAQRLADRLVYGKRATPYEVLTEFSDRVGAAYAADDVLERMAQVLAAGTCAESAAVWLQVGRKTQPVAVWPSGTVLPEVLPPDAAEVRHQGELLGALSVRMSASDPMDPAKEKLVTDLASQAGLVLRNVRLIEELKASRQRLVAAQDEERRKIERNLHDGAQQQLVALSVKAKLAQTFVAKDPGRAEQMLAELQTELSGALDDLRDLARGIYPPLLADKGLAAALEAQARKSPVSVTVEADGIGRYPQDAEAAVYFCCLEALQNIAKYANASRATVTLTNGPGELAFQITDDGIGFDAHASGYGTGLQGMSDRMAALGGSVEVRSTPGEGTTVAGRLPTETVG